MDQISPHIGGFLMHTKKPGVSPRLKTTLDYDPKIIFGMGRWLDLHLAKTSLIPSI